MKGGKLTVVFTKAFGCLASLTDVSNVPHFDLSSDVCAKCLEQEAAQIKALSGEIQQAKLEKVYSDQAQVQALAAKPITRSLLTGTSEGDDSEILSDEQQRDL